MSGTDMELCSASATTSCSEGEITSSSSTETMVKERTAEEAVRHFLDAPPEVQVQFMADVKQHRSAFEELSEVAKRMGEEDVTLRAANKALNAALENPTQPPSDANDAIKLQFQKVHDAYKAKEIEAEAERAAAATATAKAKEAGAELARLVKKRESTKLELQHYQEWCRHYAEVTHSTYPLYEPGPNRRSPTTHPLPALPSLLPPPPPPPTLDPRLLQRHQSQLKAKAEELEQRLRERGTDLSAAKAENSDLKARLDSAEAKLAAPVDLEAQPRYRNLLGDNSKMHSLIEKDKSRLSLLRTELESLRGDLKKEAEKAAAWRREKEATVQRPLQLLQGVARGLGLDAATDDINEKAVKECLKRARRDERSKAATAKEESLRKADEDAERRLTEERTEAAQSLAAKDAEFGQLKEQLAARTAEFGQLTEQLAAKNVEFGQLETRLAIALGDEGDAKAEAEIARLKQRLAAETTRRKNAEAFVADAFHVSQAERDAAAAQEDQNAE